MRKWVEFALARPRVALAGWVAATILLAVVGLGLQQRLHVTNLHVPGAESSRARSLTVAQFGESGTLPILLRGAPRSVEAQGRVLAAALEREPNVTVVSPWQRTNRVSTLRPDARTALVIASVSGSNERIAHETRAIQRLVRDTTQPGVTARVTGLPVLEHGLTRASMSAVHRAEVIALPLLLLILLLVFRSPLAAAIPVVFGAATIASGAGVLTLLADRVAIDAFATALGSMMGLALAVDYSLLIVSRFREEREATDDDRQAATIAVRHTWHTIALAGAAIGIAMAVAAGLSPGTSVLATAIAVAAFAAISVVGASLAVPAALVLWGHNLDRGRLGRGAPQVRKHASSKGGRVPAILAAAGLVGMLALALPARSLRTGAPDAHQLPSGSAERQDADAIAHVMGPGWASSFEVVAVARRGAMTTPQRLRALRRLQRQIARDPDVAAVMGPASLARSAARLRRAGRMAVADQKALPGKARRLHRLGRDVNAAAAGATGLQSALAGASSAAERLGNGTKGVASGVAQLRDGVAGAASGAQRLVRGLAGARDGARTVTAAVGTARGGARRISSGVGRLQASLSRLSASQRDVVARLRDRANTLTQAAGTARAGRQEAEQSLDDAKRVLATQRSLAAMMAIRAIDKARAAIQRSDVAGTLTDLATRLESDAGYVTSLGSDLSAGQVGRLGQATDELSSSLGRLQQELRHMGGGIDALASGGGALTEALRGVRAGTGRLDAGVGALRSGISGLRDGVRGGQQRTAALASAMREASGSVGGLGDGAAEKRSGASAPTTRPRPSFFDSGYFVLAALDSAANGTRAAYSLSLDHGGQASRVLVVPRSGVNDARTRALYKRLQSATRDFGAHIGADAAVGGPAATLIDYDTSFAGRLPAIVLVLTLVTALLLAAVLRSLLVGIIGVALNLLTVGATLGALALLFQGDHPLLGGTGRLDPVVVIGIFGVMFALSTDYQVFIVARVREEYLRTRDAGAAVSAGLARTARVVTGAALSMLGVFLAFATTDLAATRQFGVGLAIAIALDATVVRLVLLPAALRLAGRRAWPLPRARLVAAPAMTPAPAPAE